MSLLLWEICLQGAKIMHHTQDLLYISKVINHVYEVLLNESQDASDGLKQLDEAREEWKLAFTHAMSMTLK